MSDINRPIQGHEYDGIKELDNPLPAWWLFTFFGTIIFAFLYWIHYEFGGGPNTQQQLDTAMNQLQSMKKGGPSYEESQLQALFDTSTVSKGKSIFSSKCAACHREDGGGLIGPNLTDNFWIHGNGSRKDILTVISTGVPEKGMPAWGEQLEEKELLAAAAFVHSLKNTQVANGKPPQGTEVK